MSRDYILRMIEQIAAMLASIMAKRRAGQVVEARQDLDSQCLRAIGLTLDNLKKLSPEAVAELLHEAGALRPVRAVTLAELLLVEAEWNDEKMGALDSTSNRVHAFCLLADSIDALDAEDQSVYRAKLKTLAGKLQDLRSHPYLNERLQKLEL